MSKERTEGLQRAIILMHNRQVREYFKDIPDGDLSDTHLKLRFISVKNGIAVRRLRQRLDLEPCRYL